MALRTAHGTGADALVRVETSPIDELPPLNVNDTATALASAKRRGRPFERGNRAAVGRKPALASASGIPIDASDPLYRRALAQARRYRRRRVSEIAIQHGGELSAGVCGMLTSSAIDMAASRYYTAKSAQTGDMSLALLASKLAQSSRQQELTALEVAVREAATNAKRVDPSSYVWLETAKEVPQAPAEVPADVTYETVEDTDNE